MIMSPKERFDHLLAVLSSESFLNMEGLGGEIPFYICPFDAEEALTMNTVREKLITSLRNDQGIQVLEINLYDLSIELLKDRGIFERILEVEKTLSKSKIKELLQGTLDPEVHMIPAIAKKMEDSEFDILFLSGVGEVFPYIRSHTILNNLQSTAKTKPTLMFFPGKYTQSLEDGASLDLFNKLRDDKYYRAFNIYHA